jgi:hypothetical protein
MQESLGQFFADYKTARAASDRGQMRIAAELKRSFHTSERPPEDVEKWLHAREKEAVTDTIDHGRRAEILTTGDLTGPKRYLVVRDTERWRIEKVQLRCAFCEGTGMDPQLKVSTADCNYCSGSGWVQWSD